MLCYRLNLLGLLSIWVEFTIFLLEVAVVNILMSSSSSFIYIYIWVSHECGHVPYPWVVYGSHCPGGIFLKKLGTFFKLQQPGSPRGLTTSKDKKMSSLGTSQIEVPLISWGCQYIMVKPWFYFKHSPPCHFLVIFANHLARMKWGALDGPDHFRTPPIFLSYQKKNVGTMQCTLPLWALLYPAPSQHFGWKRHKPEDAHLM